MTDEMMSYEKSLTPPAKPRGPAIDRNPDRGIDTDNHGNMVYESASAEGRIEIELPSLPGSPNPTERLHAAQFGAHVAGKIESAMKQQGYLKSGAQQKPAQVFRHYLACAKGSGLMDSAAIGRMASLGNDFAAEPDQAEFYSMVVRPYLLTLTPKRR